MAKQYKGGICFSIEDTANIRGPKYANERNDCTVRALKAVCGVPYSDAHNLCRSLGRQPQRGMKCFQFLHAVLESSHMYGHKVTRVAFGNTLSRALMFCRQGRYVIITTHHVVACLNGTLYDTRTSGPNSRVIVILKFTPLTSGKQRAGA